MVDTLINAVGIVVSLGLVFGYIYLMSARPRIANIIFWLIAFPFAAFWTWGGWVIIQDFGAAGYAMFAIGVLLLTTLTIVFLDTVVRPALRPRNVR